MLIYCIGDKPVDFDEKITLSYADNTIKGRGWKINLEDNNDKPILEKNLNLS